MIEAYIDANVILRYLLNDPVDMAEEAGQLFDAMSEGYVCLWVDDVTLAEVVWVLKSFYKYPVGEITAVLRDFILQDGIIATDKAHILQALGLFETHSVDFADALLATRALTSGIPDIFSFDKHFDRLTGIRRLAPGAWETLNDD